MTDDEDQPLYKQGKGWIQIDGEWHKLQSWSAKVEIPQVSIPLSKLGFEEWCQDNLGIELPTTPRAFLKSLYEAGDKKAGVAKARTIYSFGDILFQVSATMRINSDLPGIPVWWRPPRIAKIRLDRARYDSPARIPSGSRQANRGSHLHIRTSGRARRS